MWPVSGPESEMTSYTDPNITAIDNITDLTLSIYFLRLNNLPEYVDFNFKIQKQ